MTERNPFYGATEKYFDSDYLAGGELVIPPAPYTFANLKHQYNQNIISSMSCTLHGAATAITALTNHIFSKQELQDAWRQAKELGASDTVGWYIGSACDLMRRIWNAKNPTNQLRYYRIRLSDHETVHSKGYMLVTGFRGNSTYNADVNDNGVLNNNTFGVSTYGHCVSNFTDPKEKIVDNYVGHNKYNIYELGDIAQLIKNDVFFNEAYFFVTQQSIDLMAKQQLISDWARDAVEWCRKNGYATVWTNPQQIVADAVAEKMCFNAGVLTTYTGLGITKERMAVIIYKTRKV
jgi:hypothetical protein